MYTKLLALNFTDFNLHPGIMEGVAAMGYEKPSPIQEQAIPLIMKGSDLIACAQTGTGKTAAFLLPLLHHILVDEPHDDFIRALIITPTRELAVQIDRQTEGFGYFTGVSSLAVYGGGKGADFDVEMKAIKTGAQIIIATPGRLLSHINLGYVDFSKLDVLILDEADRMLDMGFMPDIQRIIGYLPKKRQTLMFSATMPGEIRSMARKILHQHQEINLAVSKPAENVLQAAYIVDDARKIALIEKLISGRDLPLVLIFSATKTGVKEIERALLNRKMNVQAIHSDLEQEQREKVLNNFRNRDIQILVATDIVSRGIDVDNISLVINYNVPGDAEDYVHRVGRTARAEKTGLAITLINEMEYRKFERIEQFIQTTVRKLPLPAEMGESPEINLHAHKIRHSKGSRPGGKPNFRRKPRPNP